MADIKVAGKEALQTLWTRVYEEYPRGFSKGTASASGLTIGLVKGHDDNGTWVSTGQTHSITLTKADIVALGIPGSDTNTTYTLSGALSSHKFTSTLTAGGSGSGTSKSELTLVPGTNISMLDDTTNKKITISTSFEDFDGSSHGLVPAVPNFSDINVNRWIMNASGTWIQLGTLLGAIFSQDSDTQGFISFNKTGNVVGLETGNLMTDAERTKLAGIATGAEVNQNAFSRITVGSTNIDADAKSDALTLVAGSHITLTPDATNDKVTIDAAWPTVPTGADAKLADTANGAGGSAGTWARSDHQHTLNVATSGTPKMDGTAARGTSNYYARFDHVHPTDTSRAPLASPAFTGSPTVTSAPAAGDNSSKIPTTAWVQTELLSAMGDVAGALVYKGTVDAASDLLNTALKKGWYYVADDDFTLNGEQITAGDMIIVKTAGTYTTEANLDTATDIVQSNTTLLKQSDMVEVIDGQTVSWFRIPPATPSA